ncbi:MAG: hypothetical protein BGO52_17400 [Sphingobacteriales bacterium 44-61]|nr:MAG: hypothetical protein BGO52_17400 [Sphingobacteriales bacterium 44-61]
MVYNPKSSLYEIEEHGIVYGLPLELTRLLNDFSRGDTFVGGDPLIASWYKSLDKGNKKLVTRTGNIPEYKSDFYPDPEY